MAKKPKTPTRKVMQTEALSLFEFAIAEAYAQGSDKHYRLAFPYGAEKAKMVVEIYVYFDGELHDSTKADEPEKVYKINGPKKSQH